MAVAVQGTFVHPIYCRSHSGRMAALLQHIAYSFHCDAPTAQRTDPLYRACIIALSDTRLNVCKLWHALSKDLTVLPATHAFFHE